MLVISPLVNKLARWFSPDGDIRVFATVIYSNGTINSLLFHLVSESVTEARNQAPGSEDSLPKNTNRKVCVRNKGLCSVSHAM
jgi:hypothetical protein